MYTLATHPDRVRVSSRNLFEGLSADQSARPTFSISGTTRIKPGTFPPFQLDRNTLCIPRNRISRKNIFRAFPFVCKCEQSGIHMYIRIDTTVKRSVAQLWIVIARNSKACDEAETRDASYVESTDRFPCSIRRWTLVKVTYTPRDGIFPGVNWIQVDRREIEWKPPRGTLERAKRRSRFETAWRRRRKKLDLLLFIIISRNEAYLFEHVLEIILPGLDHRLVP